MSHHVRIKELLSVVSASLLLTISTSTLADVDAEAAKALAR